MKRWLRKALGKSGANRDAAARRVGLREIHADDTFIVSFPKSGNTWVRFLIASMQHPEEEISFRNIERFVPDIHKSRKAIDAMPPPRIIKSHSPFYDSFPRFVYVLRDGRDAMISYYHYALGRGAFRGTLSEFLESREAGRYGTWSHHAMVAMEHAERDPERVLMVRYEDLISSPLDQATRIAEFCRLDTGAEDIRAAVTRCRFQRLQEIERRHGGEIEDSAFLFFRRGVHGQWRDPAVASELRPFIAQAEEALSSLGYHG